MISAPLPPNEAERLAVLDALNVMHTLPEQAYDDIALLASRICGTPMAMVSLVGEDEQWWKAHVGTEKEGTPRNVAFCAHVILDPDRVMVVPDATQDERFHDNPLVTGEDGVRFYAGAPLVAENGEALGALCVVDRKPRQFSAEEEEALRVLARSAMTLMMTRRTIQVLEEHTLNQQKYVEHLETYQQHIEAAQAQLHRDAITDGLTGLYNRRAFEQRLAEELPRAARGGLALSLILLDVDRFKEYNDTYGHPAGDEVLVKVGMLLAMTARAQDLVFRYGGEEFAVLLPGTDAHGAHVLADRFRRIIQAHAWPHRTITASFGTTTFRGAGDTRERFVRAADEALYAAKRAGRNRVVDGDAGDQAAA